MCCCNRLAGILLKIFSSMFIMDIGLKFSFLGKSLPGFGIRMIFVSYNDLGRIPCFGIVWNSFRRSVTSSSLYVWQNSAVYSSGPGLFLGSRPLIAASTSAVVIYLFRFSSSSWFRLGRMLVSRNLSISSRFTSLCAYSCL